ncbi:FMN-dependent NADH-azoreductase 2 [Bienertia sinuspersici]
MKMRIITRSIRQFQSILRHQGENYGVCLAQRRYLSYQRSSYSYEKAQLCRYAQPLSLISRSLSADAVRVPNIDGNKGGPLVEYERRVAAGELFDGDLCQVYDGVKILKCLVLTF